MRHECVVCAGRDGGKGGMEVCCHLQDDGPLQYSLLTQQHCHRHGTAARITVTIQPGIRMQGYSYSSMSC